jgi:hypothetical protein
MTSLGHIAPAAVHLYSTFTYIALCALLNIKWERH